MRFWNDGNREREVIGLLLSGVNPLVLCQCTAVTERLVNYNRTSAREMGGGGGWYDVREYQSIAALVGYSDMETRRMWMLGRWHTLVQKVHGYGFSLV